jgi:hypothetical protein
MTLNQIQSRPDRSLFSLMLSRHEAALIDIVASPSRTTYEFEDLDIVTGGFSTHLGTLFQLNPKNPSRSDSRIDLNTRAQDFSAGLT